MSRHTHLSCDVNAVLQAQRDESVVGHHVLAGHQLEGTRLQQLHGVGCVDAVVLTQAPLRGRLRLGLRRHRLGHTARQDHGAILGGGATRGSAAGEQGVKRQGGASGWGERVSVRAGRRLWRLFDAGLAARTRAQGIMHALLHKDET